jgi:hypothetical protein
VIVRKRIVSANYKNGIGLNEVQTVGLTPPQLRAALVSKQPEDMLGKVSVSVREMLAEDDKILLQPGDIAVVP